MKTGAIVNSGIEHHIVLSVDGITFQVPRRAIRKEGKKRVLDERAEIEHIFPRDIPGSSEEIGIPEGFVERLKQEKQKAS